MALLLTSLMSLGSISNSMAMRNNELDPLINRDRILSPLRERRNNRPLTDDWYWNYSTQDFVLPIKGNEDYCIVVNFTMSMNLNSVMGYSYNEETDQPEWKELNRENWKQNAKIFRSRELLSNICGMPVVLEDVKLTKKIEELGIADYSEVDLNNVIKALALLSIGLLLKETVRRRTKKDKITQNKIKLRVRCNDF